MNLKDLRLEIRADHPIHFGYFAENRERLLADLFSADSERAPTGRRVVRLVQKASRRCRKNAARASGPEHSTGLFITASCLAIVSEANWDVDGNALSIRPVPQYVRQSRLYVKAQSMRREFVLADQPTGPTAVNSHYIIGHWEIIPRLSALATACLSGRDTLTFHLCTTKWRFVYTRRYNNLSGHLGVRLGRWQRLHIGRHEITPEEVEEVFDGDYKVRRARQKLMPPTAKLSTAGCFSLFSGDCQSG
jgi:hypothetical protein